MKAPFASIQEEIAALRERSDFYGAKISALRVGGWNKNRDEIKQFQTLDQQCQRCIAFYIGQQMKPVE